LQGNFFAVARVTGVDQKAAAMTIETTHREI
jgi:hypothetical protein